MGKKHLSTLTFFGRLYYFWSALIWMLAMGIVHQSAGQAFHAIGNIQQLRSPRLIDGTISICNMPAGMILQAASQLPAASCCYACLVPHSARMLYAISYYLPS